MILLHQDKSVCRAYERAVFDKKHKGKTGTLFHQENIEVDEDTGLYWVMYDSSVQPFEGMEFKPTESNDIEIDLTTL